MSFWDFFAIHTTVWVGLWLFSKETERKLDLIMDKLDIDNEEHKDEPTPQPTPQTGKRGRWGLK